jgi:iron complex transport system substrate-binding protein
MKFLKMPKTIKGLIFLFTFSLFLIFSKGVYAQQRIIALTPALAEMVSLLLDPPYSEIVGVTEYTNFPLSLAQKPSIGPYPKVNLEKLISLKPTLIFATTEGNAKEQVEWIRKQGILVRLFDPKTTSQMSETLTAISLDLEKSERARELIKKFNFDIEHLKAEVAQWSEGKRGKVFFQLDQNPLISIGRSAFVSMVLTEFGIQNIFSDLERAYPRISKEEVIKRNPDWIVILNAGLESRSSGEMVNFWNANRDLSAVQKKQVLSVQSDQLVRPTFRILAGVREIAQRLFKVSLGVSR